MIGFKNMKHMNDENVINEDEWIVPTRELNHMIYNIGDNYPNLGEEEYVSQDREDRISS